MAITSYADLINAVRDWMARANDTVNLTDDRIGECIQFAETEIYDQLRVDAMEGEVELTVSAQRVTMPPNCIEPRRVYLDATPLVRMEYRAPAQFWVEAASNTTGKPTMYTMEGDTIVFGPIPDQTYTAKVWCYQRPVSLSVTTNAIFLARPHMYLFGALSHAALFAGIDPAEPQGRASMWRANFENAMQDAQAASDRGTYSSTPLAIRPG